MLNKTDSVSAIDRWFSKMHALVNHAAQPTRLHAYIACVLHNYVNSVSIISHCATALSNEHTNVIAILAIKPDLQLVY